MKIYLPKLHTAQYTIYKDTARFKVLACGRRFGKSLLCCITALASLLEGKKVYIVYPSYPMSTVGYRILHSMARQIPIIEVNKVERLVRCKGNDGFVQFKSADNPDSLRGEGLDLAIIDEAAFCSEDTWNAALRPALSDRKGKALIISTPKGKNFFYRLYNEGLQGGSEIKSFHYTTYDNPYVDKNEIEQAKKELPESVFRQEYLAEFVDINGMVFRNIDNCIRGKLSSPEPNRQYVIGVDVARASDFTVICVIDCKTCTVVHVYRTNNTTWNYVKVKIVEIAKQYNNAIVMIDSTGVGDVIYDDIKRNGEIQIVPYLFTRDSKQKLVETLMLAIEKETISIPAECNDMIFELRAYEAKTNINNVVQYSAPSGLHDDCVMALGLAVIANNKYGVTSHIG